MESENVKLRRRKYSEVKNDFVYRTQFNKVRYLKKVILKMSIIPLSALLIGGYMGMKDGSYRSAINFTIMVFVVFGIILLLFSFLLFLIPYRHPRIGVHPEGVWLWNTNIGDIGFIEWGWIEGFYISKEAVSINVYDIEKIRKDIIKTYQKLGMMYYGIYFDPNIILCIPVEYFSSEMLDYITKNKLSKVSFVE